MNKQINMLFQTLNWSDVNKLVDRWDSFIKDEHTGPETWRSGTRMEISASVYPIVVDQPNNLRITLGGTTTRHITYYAGANRTNESVLKGLALTMITDYFKLVNITQPAMVSSGLSDVVPPVGTFQLAPNFFSLSTVFSYLYSLKNGIEFSRLIGDNIDDNIINDMFANLPEGKDDEVKANLEYDNTSYLAVHMFDFYTKYEECTYSDYVHDKFVEWFPELDSKFGKSLVGNLLIVNVEAFLEFYRNLTGQPTVGDCYVTKERYDALMSAIEEFRTKNLEKLESFKNEADEQFNQVVEKVEHIQPLTSDDVTNAIKKEFTIFNNTRNEEYNSKISEVLKSILDSKEMSKELSDQMLIEMKKVYDLLTTQRADNSTSFIKSKSFDVILQLLTATVGSYLGTSKDEHVEKRLQLK